MSAPHNKEALKELQKIAAQNIEAGDWVAGDGTGEAETQRLMNTVGDAKLPKK